MKPPTPHRFLSIPGLPEATRPMIARLLAEEPIPASELARRVGVYRRIIEDSAAKNLAANIPLGIAIAGALHAVLARVDERTGREDLRVIQVAVRFFVIENDGYGHDLAHEDGLFADARVVNAMLRWLGRDDLFLPLPVPAAERRPNAQGRSSSADDAAEGRPSGPVTRPDRGAHQRAARARAA